MRLELTNEEIHLVIVGLRADDMRVAQELSQALADRIEALSLDTCLESASGNHFMVKPAESQVIQWGEFGVCRSCKVVRRMD